MMPESKVVKDKLISELEGVSSDAIKGEHPMLETPTIPLNGSVNVEVSHEEEKEYE